MVHNVISAYLLLMQTIVAIVRKKKFSVPGKTKKKAIN